jgi:hypothetical protein
VACNGGGNRYGVEYLSLSSADKLNLVCCVGSDAGRRLREGLGKLCGRTERCLGRRYMACAINASRATRRRDRCDNFTRNGKLNDQYTKYFS